MMVVKTMNKYHKQYCRALAIVHGASELQIVGHIKSKLRLPLECYSRNNGRTSIQINSLMDVLNNEKFKKPKNFFKEYPNINHYKNIPNNFAIFTVMDTDDCDEKTRSQYINKSLFNGHWLRPYIIPIYNMPNLEEILVKCKIIDKPLSNKEKIPTYKSIFPIASDVSNHEEIENLKTILSKYDKTNLNEFLEYCLKWAYDSKIKL